MEVYGFKSFAKLLRLGYVFFKTESFESFKKRPWTRKFDHCRPRLDFFSCRGFEVQSKPLKHFFLAYHLIKSGRELSIHSIITVIHFSTAIKLQRIQAFLQNYFKELYSARFDLSITALVLILDISCLTRLPRESSCHENRWTDHMRLFRALQSRNWNARFCSTKKNWKASENVQKSEITL